MAIDDAWARESLGTIVQWHVAAPITQTYIYTQKKRRGKKESFLVVAYL